MSINPYQSLDIAPEEGRDRPRGEFKTGVPIFLGYAAPITPSGMPVALQTPKLVAHPSEFEPQFGLPLPDSYLADAVRGFFVNGGRQCYVIALDPAAPTRIAALQQGLAAVSKGSAADIVAAPDIMRLTASAESPTMEEILALQNVLLEHCDRMGNRFAILDGVPASPQAVINQRQGLEGINGALYYPWVKVVPANPSLRSQFVPPCGHLAGIYARTDEKSGVHKVPANEQLTGVLDLMINLRDAQQNELNPHNINCLRSFPGRGIRVWGARSLSREAQWSFINLRRLFLTASRWLDYHLAGLKADPANAQVSARVVRELTTYFGLLLQAGALKGTTPKEAFYIKCDETTNPPAVRDAGQIVAEVGLALNAPSDFVVMWVVYDDQGVTVTQTQPATL